jgi:UDP-N-acetylmuramyl pentapeptide phosphotransferase/UDP-N-acetylglucosamine-1-phosphate transferase
VALSALLAGVGAAAVTALLAPLVIRLALRTGVVDRPGGPLKPHDRPVPYLGGVAVFCGVLAATIGSAHPAVLLPLTLALVLGLLDDVTSLPAIPRLVVELGIGASVAWVTGADGPVEGTCVALVTVALVNALNMVDGIDGLALGMCAVTGLGFALAVPGGWIRFAAALTGATAGLLQFNRPPARIYLGDAGSYLLGTAVAVLAGASWSATGSAPELLVVAALVGYPWVELVSTVGRRLLTRRPLFGGDRDHVYDRMERAGIGKAGVTGMLVAGQAVVSGLAVAAHLFGSTALAVVPVVVLLAATVLAALPATSRRR